MGYYAKIKWHNGKPASVDFDDIYYASDNGLDEVNYVFLKHNNLSSRFASLEDNDTFIIAESGFGSGLNFLATQDLWNKTVKSRAKLFFISFEKHPISPQDIREILNKFDSLDSADFLAQYYILLPGTQRLTFKNNVVLNLNIGDIKDTISKYNFQADAWFLDGFTPSRNGDMWTDFIVSNISRLSKTGTTFATFTASSSVKKTLQANGFNVIKDKGYTKREMLYGICDKPNKISEIKPWLVNYHNINIEKKVIIVGGGISGAATAYSLARRGYKVTIYEKNSDLGMEASGNYQAIVYGNFSGNYTPVLELNYSSYRYTNYLIKSLLTDKVDYAQSGVVQLAHNTIRLKQQNQILSSNVPEDFCHSLTQQEIENLAGIKINCSSGLYFPYGIWLSPKAFISKLVNHPNITIKLNCTITNFEFKNKWVIETSTKDIDDAENIVLCNSHMLNQFSHTNSFNLRKTRGQISKIKGNLGLKTIICGDGYITPNLNDLYTIGATFKNENDLDVKITDHEENIQQLSNLINNLNIALEDVTGQVSFRAHTNDYLPLVGPIADYKEFMQCYQKLSLDANYKINTPCPYLPGLFINSHFGAKGMLFAPLCGEIIADYIDGTPSTISESLRQALHPHRLWIKEIIKHKDLK